MGTIIKDFSQLDFTKKYTIADYLSWQFRERVELIMGKIFMMSPAPSSLHQQVVSDLHATFHSFLKGKTCRVFPAPFDVYLFENDAGDTVVQPDITVICDLSKIKMEGCKGAPDLVIEVVSKGSVKHDLHEKFTLYEKAGIPEYWLVNPSDRSLVIFNLEGGTYQPSKPLTAGDIAESKVLNGLKFNLDEVFTNAINEPEALYQNKIKRIP
jgi:Uma2 family endonuclease